MPTCTWQQNLNVRTVDLIQQWIKFSQDLIIQSDGGLAVAIVASNQPGRYTHVHPGKRGVCVYIKNRHIS